jgi:hypothetical protein
VVDEKTAYTFCEMATGGDDGSEPLFVRLEVETVSFDICCVQVYEYLLF